MNLWEWRRDQLQKKADSTPYKREIAQFGSWFVSGRLDLNWAFQQLLFAIQFSEEIASDYRVVEHFAALAREFPVPVVECIDAMVRKATKPWRIYAWHKQAFDALRVVVESGNPDAGEKAKKVANRFGEMGFRDFKALVNPLSKKE